MVLQLWIFNLRDDFFVAVYVIWYVSYFLCFECYFDNIEYVISCYCESEVYMRSVGDILQRVCEIVFQGVQGIYLVDDFCIMVVEVNQMINQFVDIGNVCGVDGVMFFVGDWIKSELFCIIEGRVVGFDELVIMSVDYIGIINKNQIEIVEGVYVGFNFLGNEVFWVEN